MSELFQEVQNLKEMMMKIQDQLPGGGGGAAIGGRSKAGAGDLTPTTAKAEPGLGNDFKMNLQTVK